MTAWVTKTQPALRRFAVPHTLELMELLTMLFVNIQDTKASRKKCLSLRYGDSGAAEFQGIHSALITMDHNFQGPRDFVIDYLHGFANVENRTGIDQFFDDNFSGTAFRHFRG